MCRVRGSSHVPRESPSAPGSRHCSLCSSPSNIARIGDSSFLYEPSHDFGHVLLGHCPRHPVVLIQTSARMLELKYRISPGSKNQGPAGVVSRRTLNRLQNRCRCLHQPYSKRKRLTRRNARKRGRQQELPKEAPARRRFLLTCVALQALPDTSFARVPSYAISPTA